MAEVFYAPRDRKSLDFTAFVLKKYYAQNDVRFFTSRHGKPYCDAPFYFSLSHTTRLIFLCVARGEAGVDAEETRRGGNFLSVKKRLSPCERAVADTSQAEFLKTWTRREATTKYLDLPVFSSFSRLVFKAENGAAACAEDLFPVYGKAPLPVELQTFELGGHFVSLCLTKGETVRNIRYIDGF
ncbi:MAG: 4'-phosphopantetheinyl transferase family protein [Candidatus Scatosoma sp.]